jgi:hypothetical protein
MKTFLLSSLLFITGVSYTLAGLAADATEPVPAYEGCTLAWDYDEATAHLVESFFINVDERTGHAQVGGPARSIPCSTLNLTLGSTHLLKVRAYSTSLGYSAPAEITVAYQPKPTLTAPTNIRVQLEWAP